MKIVGVDPSLTSTGVAVITKGNPPMVDRIEVKRTRGLSRLRVIRAEVYNWVKGARLVVIEGPAYGSSRTMQAGHHERAGLWWFLIDLFDRLCVPWAVVPPNMRARYATGKANAGKDEVLAAAIKRYPEADVSGNDEADALVLAAMGARWVGFPLEQRLPIACLEALDKVEWPEVCT